MRQKLTDLTIRQLQLPEKGAEKYWDASLPGFGVRVSQGGTKSFVVMYGRERRLKTLGRYPAMSLKTARRAAQAILDDPNHQERPKTLSEALSAYLSECETRLRPSTVASYAFYLRPLRAVSFDTLSRASTPVSPHYVMAAKVFLNWCIRQGYTTTNPWQHERAQYGQRDRVLSDDEIRAVWRYDHPPFSTYCKVILLTGLRRGEPYHLSLGANTVTVPASHTKNGHAHELPLTPLLAQYLPLPYFNGWSKAMARLRQHTGCQGFTLHDLRRTFATRHAQLGTPIHVVEQLLNHRSGTISGVAKIYIRHSFLTEARTAQLAYEQHILDIVSA